LANINDPEAVAFFSSPFAGLAPACLTLLPPDVSAVDRSGHAGRPQDRSQPRRGQRHPAGATPIGRARPRKRRSGSVPR
jgi:hypothetical protein